MMLNYRIDTILVLLFLKRKCTPIAGFRIEMPPALPGRSRPRLIACRYRKLRPRWCLVRNFTPGECRWAHAMSQHDRPTLLLQRLNDGDADASEEQGLQGSRLWASSLSEKEREGILAGVVLDMVGEEGSRRPGRQPTARPSPKAR